MADQNNSGLNNEKESFNESGDDSSANITISLDSTLTRGGGLLILHKIRKIYFYSLNWSHVIWFPDASKIHLFNAAVALELFEEFLEKYPRIMVDNGEGRKLTKEKLIFETKSLIHQNSMCEEEDQRKKPSSLDKAFLHIIEGKLKSEPFQGEWKYFDGLDDDKIETGHDEEEDQRNIRMQLCRRLAEENCTFGEALSNIWGKDREKNEQYLYGYSIENVSESVSAMLAIVSIVLQFPK